MGRDTISAEQILTTTGCYHGDLDTMPVGEYLIDAINKFRRFLEGDRSPEVLAWAYPNRVPDREVKPELWDVIAGTLPGGNRP